MTSAILVQSKRNTYTVPVGYMYLESVAVDLNRGLPQNESQVVVREVTQTWGL